MKNSYNELLMDRLIHIITLSCQTSELCQYFLFIIINANLMSTYTTYKVFKFYKNYRFFVRFQSEARYIGVNYQAINTIDSI